MSEDRSHPFPADPTRLLFLKGSDFEMGRQHGEQVGASGSDGMLQFYMRFWQGVLSVKSGGMLTRLASGMGKYLLHSLVVDKLRAGVDEAARERVRGCAQATGLPFDEMMTVLILPDLLPILQAYLTKIRPRTFIEAAPPRFGCSSFISLGKKFLHGRNLDFPGVGYWDRYPVIQMMQRPGSLRVIGFTTAGVPLAGITGVNEAQISVSLHQHYCGETSLRGKLPFAIGEEILFKARSLQDALVILRRSQVASSWAFIITDGKTRRGLIYEAHARAAGVRFLTEDEPLLVHSNFFQTPQCRPAEYATSIRMNWDNYWRKQRLHELVAARGNELTAAEAALFLCDHFDRYWNEEKPFNRTVSQVYNIQSMVLDPENMKVLFAEGDAPIHLRSFREYDLGAMFAGRDAITGNTTPAYRFKSENLRRAKEAYILSFIAAFDGRYDKALSHLSDSLRAEFTHEGALVAAVLNLKKGEYAPAATLLEKAKGSMESKMKERGLRQPPPEFFETELFLARAYDLQGDRSKAVKMYQAVASHPGLLDPNLRRIAAAEGPYTPSHLTRILMPYSSYIPFA